MDFQTATTPALDTHTDPFVLKQNSDKLSAYFRRRRFALISQLIKEISDQKGSCRIIDVGGRAEYWNPALDVLRSCKAHVTIVNLESTQPEPGPLFEFKYGDACDLSECADGEFDLAHSNSLIEHVGNWQRVRQCADEIRRLAGAYYVQTPYFWFPFEPHFRTPFFHWLPEQLRARAVMNFQLGYFNRAAGFDQAMENVQSAYLLDRKQFGSLFADAEIRFERVALLPKSLIAVRRGRS